MLDKPLKYLQCVRSGVSEDLRRLVQRFGMILVIGDHNWMAWKWPQPRGWHLIGHLLMPLTRYPYTSRYLLLRGMFDISRRTARRTALMTHWTDFTDFAQERNMGNSQGVPHFHFKQ